MGNEDKAEKIFNDPANKTDRDFYRSRYTVVKTLALKEAIGLVEKIPSSEKTEKTLKLQFALYQATGLCQVQDEHMRPDYFAEALPYRVKAVVVQREIMAKNNHRDEQLTLAKALYHLAIAKSENNYIAGADENINEAISLITSHSNISPSFVEKLSEYYYQAFRIAGKFQDFGKAYKNYQNCERCLLQLKEINPNFSYDEEHDRLEFALHQLFRKPNAALKLAQQYVETKRQLDNANLQIKSLQTELESKQEEVKSLQTKIQGIPKTNGQKEDSKKIPPLKIFDKTEKPKTFTPYKKVTLTRW